VSYVVATDDLGHVPQVRSQHVDEQNLQRFKARSRAAAPPVPVTEGGIGADGSGHGHLWVLRDGTAAHAPPGVLTRNGDGQVACHLCGRWFNHLGLHLRRHGWSADEYREAVGLSLHAPLCSRQLSGEISVRQQHAWDQDPAMRARLDFGHELARSGDLARFAVDAAHERETTGRTPPATRAARGAALAAGRDTTRRERQDQLAQLITDSGALDLPDLLRSAYTDGATLESLAQLTGLGRRRLREALTAAGVTIRRTGRNVPASKQRRSQLVDARVADHVGTTDVRSWLIKQRESGFTLAALARQTGRSIPWVRSRLAGTTTTGHAAATVPALRTMSLERRVG
jgi:hypothetical protein